MARLYAFGQRLSLKRSSYVSYLLYSCFLLFSIVALEVELFMENAPIHFHRASIKIGKDILDLITRKPCNVSSCYCLQAADSRV